jgi:uncharacterized membrane protein YfcA
LTIAAIFLCGCIVGFLGAFLGIGGGVIIIPFLTIVLGYPIHEAIATSLAVVVANSITTSYAYLSGNMVNLRLGFVIALFSILGSVLGGIIGLNATAQALYLTIGAAQMITAIFMLKKRNAEILSGEGGGWLSGEYYDPAEKKIIRYTPKRLTSVFGVAGAAGVLSGMVGIGGGVFLVPAMNILSRVPIKAVTTTSGLIMGFTAAGGGILYMLHGYTRTNVVAVMFLGIFISTRIAAKHFTKVNSINIYRAFVIFLLFVAVQMIYRGIMSNSATN